MKNCVNLNCKNLFSQILKALPVEWRNSTPRFALLPERRNKTKILNSLFPRVGIALTTIVLTTLCYLSLKHNNDTTYLGLIQYIKIRIYLISSLSLKAIKIKCHINMDKLCQVINIGKFNKETATIIVL